MNERFVFIDRWCYTMPDAVPDEDGNIVLISKKSFGPLEVCEWGLDNNHNPYERYEWLENDLYEDERYCKNISKEELLKQIYNVISIFRSNGLSEWINFYMEILDRPGPGLPG